MGIGGYILAGALQGAGNAITTQANSDADARRAMALQRLKTQDAMQTTLFQAKVNDASDASKQARANQYQTQQITARGDVQKDVDTNRGNIAATNDAANDARDHTNATALENLRTRNDLTKADHQAAIDAVQADSEITRVETLASGQLMGVTKSGNTKPLMGRSNGRPIYLATAKPGQSGGDGGGGATVGSALASRGGSGSAPAASASPAPRGIGTRASGGSSAPAAQTSRAAAQEQPNGNAYSADDNFALSQKLNAPGYFADAAASMARPTTYTVQQLHEFAQATGKSDAEARDWARTNGFTITR